GSMGRVACAGEGGEPHCITVWGNVLDLDRDDIAAAKLAIDSQVKQGEVTYSPLHEQSGSNRPNVLWSQGRSRPDQLAFVPRHAVGGRCAIFIVWHGRTPLLQG